MTEEKLATRFRVGDRVDVQKPLSYEGQGQIIQVSTDWDSGMGTKTYPRFLVEFDDGRTEWCSGVSLTRI